MVLQLRKAGPCHGSNRVRALCSREKALPRFISQKDFSAGRKLSPFPFQPTGSPEWRPMRMRICGKAARSLDRLSGGKGRMWQDTQHHGSEQGFCRWKAGWKGFLQQADQPLRLGGAFGHHFCSPGHGHLEEPRCDGHQSHMEAKSQHRAFLCLPVSSGLYPRSGNQL